MMADIHDSCSMTPPMSPSLAFPGPMDSEDVMMAEMEIPDKEPEGQFLDEMPDIWNWSHLRIIEYL